MSSTPETTFDQERLLRRVDDLSSQIRTLESELDQAHRLATLGTLAGSIAHEFNNILTPVLSYAQMAISAPEDRAFSLKALQKAADGAERASDIASAMLGFIRDDRGYDSADVMEAANAALACIAHDAGKRGILLEVHLTSEARVCMRPTALQQVFLNLALNAMEALGSGGGTISIREKNGSPGDDGNDLHIDVADTGRGIAPSQLPMLFQPLHSERQDPSFGKGTGLGLWICRRLVEGAGGSIDVRSELGRGTTFHLRLPRAAPSSA